MATLVNPRDALKRADRIEEILTQLCNWTAYGVGELVQQARAEAIEQNYARRVSNGTVDATGVCEVTFQVPLGTAWLLRSIATTGAVNGGVMVFLNSTSDGQNLVRAMAGSTYQSDDFAEGAYFPGGSNVVVRFESQTVGARVTAALQVEQLNDTVPTNVEPASHGNRVVISEAA